MLDETVIRHILINMLKKFLRTRLIATDANVQTHMLHTNSTPLDDEYILMGMNFNSGPIRKYTQVDVGVRRLLLVFGFLNYSIYFGTPLVERSP